MTTTPAADTFTRTVTGGWGTADTGGAWTITNATYFSTNGTQGLISSASGSTAIARLASVSSTSTEVVVNFGISKLPVGGNMHVYINSRSLADTSLASTAYGVDVQVAPTGAVTLSLRISGVDSATTATLATITAADRISARVRVNGVSPTNIAARVWKSSTTEPSAWQLNVTDSTSGLQVVGGIAVGTFLSSAATNGPITATWDGLTATTVDNLPPVVTVGSDQIATLNTPVTVTGTAADTDGAVASTAWTWNLYPASLSSAPAITGANTLSASFTPTVPGAYVLTLTATDNAGVSAHANALVDVPAAAVTVNNDLENSGGWTGAYTDIDELENAPDDTNYVTSSGTGTRTFWLAPAIQNTAGYVWVRCDQPASGGTLTVELLQGTAASTGTPIGSWPINVPTNAPTTFRFALTATQISAITDWNRLQLRFS